MNAREWLTARMHSMSARARRHEAVEDAKLHLDRWRDYGDPADLRTAIVRLTTEGDTP